MKAPLVASMVDLSLTEMENTADILGFHHTTGIMGIMGITLILDPLISLHLPFVIARHRRRRHHHHHRLIECRLTESLLTENLIMGTAPHPLLCSTTATHPQVITSQMMTGPMARLGQLIRLITTW